MQTPNSGIYTIKNKKSGAVYVGQAVDIRKRRNVHFSLLRNNKHSNRHLQHSYNKYGKEAFDFIVLFYCNKEHLTMFEQLTVDFYVKKNIKIYNILHKCVDSWLGMSHSQETIEKLRQKLSGKNAPRYGKSLSEEHKKKIGKANKGKVRTTEGLKNLSDAHIGKQLGEKNPNSKLSDAEREEIITLLINSALTQKEIGDIYNVHRTTIGKIKRKITDGEKNIS